jgi:molybdopterin-containing oxidoreductase family membrane subunit
MVQTLMLVMRKAMRLEAYIHTKHVEYMNIVIMVTGSIVGTAYITELFISWYSGVEYEAYAFLNRATGPYWWAYWAMMTCNVISPQLMWFKKLRRSLLFTFIISIVVNIGMWFERFVIIVTSVHRDYLPSSWSMFYPTHIDIGIFIGTIGLFFVFFLLFARFFPVLALNEVKTILKSSGESFKNGQAHSPAYSIADQHLAFKVSHDHDDHSHGHTTSHAETTKVETTAEKATDSKMDILLNAVGRATAADKDDLKSLNGLGPAIETKLNEIGIFTFAQLAKMTKAEYDLLDELIDLRGRAEKDDWAGQANDLLNNNEN